VKDPARVLAVALATAFVHLWIQRSLPSSLPPLKPASKRKQKAPEYKPGMSAIDANRLRDDYGYEGRHRSPGQRAGIAKMLLEDTDA
jgi:hypothetical protein